MTENRRPFPAEAEGMTITIDDVRDSGHCTKGARRWFERRQLDFRGFLEGGIDAREFYEQGDELAAIVIERTVARRRA